MMETSSKEYQEHLEQKYLPGRSKYLQWFFYPKIMRQFNDGKIVDLGCGTGEFLKYLKLKNREFSGTDNNPHLVEKCRQNGFDVIMDDVTKLENIQGTIENAILDNVLEHLDLNQINSFFSAIKNKMSKNGKLVIVVPDKKGYQYDPTHKTFVNPELIGELCSNYDLVLERTFRHPFNLSFIGKILYLNMQVFTLRF